MFALPWADDAFDVVTSFNGVWGGCDDALAEMARVVRPGGTVAITFWGSPAALDLRDYFIVLGSTMPAVASEMVEMAQIGDPGVAERMLAGAGLDVVERGTTSARLELADDDVAWRALRSPGLAVPPLAAVGEDELRRRVLDAAAPFRADDGSYLLTNELVHVHAPPAVARRGVYHLGRDGPACGRYGRGMSTSGPDRPSSLPTEAVGTGTVDDGLRPVDEATS